MKINNLKCPKCNKVFRYGDTIKTDSDFKKSYCNNCENWVELEVHNEE